MQRLILRRPRLIYAILNWSGAVLALLVALKSLYPALNPLFLWISAAAAVLGSVFHGFNTARNKHVFSVRAIKSFLRQLQADITEDFHVSVRCNLMVVGNGTLTQAVRYPTSSTKTPIWEVGQGCCGICAKRQQPTLADLGDLKGKPYEELLIREDHQPMWGLTREQWEHTRDLGSVVSVPIFYPSDPSSVAGVLNVDSGECLSDWLPAERRDDFLRRVRAYAESCATFVGEGLRKEMIGDVPD